MDVGVLVLDGVFDTGLATILDTLAIANGLAGPRPPFRVRLLGMRTRVRTSHGLQVPVVVAKRRPDVVLMPALGAKSPDTIQEALARRDVVDACDLITSWQTAGVRIAGACTATFVLAEAGLLDGQRATTTWWLAPTFRIRFPTVELEESRMVVEAKGAVTVGAALAHLDLALWLVRQHSPTVARATARHLLYDAAPTQAAFVLPDYVAHADDLVERFEAWARRHLTDFSIAAASRAVGASERTLERRLRHVLGKSPLSYVQDLRVAHAIDQLETTGLSLDEIANRVGYGDGTTLGTLIRKKTGRSVRELRARG